MIQFIFFDMADNVLFVRDDAESATWTHEEYKLVATFPYNPDKEITRGMRVGFRDQLGVLQVFEIRKARTYEPDHYQEITAEHIVVAELSDDYYAGDDIYDETPQQVLTTILTGTLWSLGSVNASNLSSASLNRGDVWMNVRTVERNWNVLVTPRVTFSPTGITGRYLDVEPNVGVWRGVRLSLEKNADELGVTIDDSDVVTAMYGYGKSTGQAGRNGDPLTFGSVVWAATADHPAKPAGQTYIEDTAATALYGRNGRPRFSSYQNSDISDPELLLEKTWESLRTVNVPKVTIDCQVRDLYRMGYADQPLRLHDTCIVDIRQTGQLLKQDIIKLSEDLLDPTCTRVTIGAYIPNIIYMQMETNERASGGQGGSKAKGQTREEFETGIEGNSTVLRLYAVQNDLTTLDGVVRQSTIDITAQGVTISTILNNVGDGTQVTAATIATAIVGDTSSITLIADKIELMGFVTASELASDGAYITSVTADSIDVAGGDVTIDSSGISCANLDVNGTDLSGIGSTVSAVRISGPTNNVYTLQYQTYDSDTWVDAGSFNRAQAVTLSDPTWGTTVTGSSNTFRVDASNGESKSQSVYLWRESDWANGERDVYLSHTDSTAAHQVAKLTMYIPTIEIPSAWGMQSTDPGADVLVSLNSAYTYHKATIKCGGRSKTVRVKII